MNNLINSRNMYITLFIGICLLMIFFAKSPDQSYDSYWHLKMGHDLLFNGLSPFVDHYSFTNNGERVQQPPVIFQTTLAYVVYIFGSVKAGYFAYKAIYIVALATTLMLYLKNLNSPAIVVVFLIPLYCYFLESRLMLRPELLSNIFIVLSFILYFKAREDFSNRNLLYISILMLAWVNYHSPVIGYIIFFGLFLDRFIYKIIHKNNAIDWKLFWFWGAVVFLVGFVNVDLKHFVLETIEFAMSGMGKTTEEYIPTIKRHSSNIMVYLLWGLTIISIIWAIIKKQYGLLLVLFVMLYISLAMVRMMPVAALVNICVLAYLVSGYINNKEYLALKKTVVNLVVSCLALVTLFSSYEVFRLIKKNHLFQSEYEPFMEQRHPVWVTSYLKKNTKGGKILNPMHVGGYLLAELAPEHQVYLDGRTYILHPLSMLDRYENILKDSSLMKEEVNQYDVDFVLLENHSNEFSLMQKIDALQLVYADEQYMLFGGDKTVNRYKYLSETLITPACMTSLDYKKIDEEYKLAESGYKDSKHVLKELANLLRSYSRTENKVKFLEEKTKALYMKDSIKRVLGYVALKEKLYGISAKFFSGIVKNEHNDVYLSIYMTFLSGQHNDVEKTLLKYMASQVLYFMPGVEDLPKYKTVSRFHASLLLSMLEEINSKSGLKYFKGNDFQYLVSSHNKHGGAYGRNIDLGNISAEICMATKKGYGWRTSLGN